MIDELEIIDAAMFDKHKKTIYMRIFDYGYAGAIVNWEL